MRIKIQLSVSLSNENIFEEIYYDTLKNDNNCTRTHNDLGRKRTLNHLAKLA